jgi:hypothetical protein
VTKTKTGTIFLVAAAFLALSTGAFAQSVPGKSAYKDNRFFINFGGQLVNLGSSLQLNSGPFNVGTVLHPKEDLGVDSSRTTWRIDMGWRFTERNQIVFSYFEVNRSGEKLLDRSFSYHGYDYTVGAKLHTKQDETYCQLKYRYYFYQGDRGEFGLQVGLSYNDISSGLTLLANGSGGGLQATLGHEVKAAMGAPTATLGFAGSFEFTEKIFFRGDVGWLQVDLNGYRGTVTNLRATVDYYPLQNVGFGGGYEYNGLKIKADKSNWDGNLKSNLSSLIAYVSFKF